MPLWGGGGVQSPASLISSNCYHIANMKLLDKIKLDLFLRIGSSLSFDRIELETNKHDDIVSVKFTNTNTEK